MLESGLDGLGPIAVVDRSIGGFNLGGAGLPGFKVNRDLQGVGDYVHGITGGEIPGGLRSLSSSESDFNIGLVSILYY